jgi:hypothetical protein
VQNLQRLQRNQVLAFDSDISIVVLNRISDSSEGGIHYQFKQPATKPNTILTISEIPHQV